MKYDYLIVGSGLFGSVFAYEANKKGKKCLVIEKRNHIGGNIYTECIDDINVHKYGAHIFHTSNKKVWDYVNEFAEFNRYTNEPVAIYKNELYNLPFNLNTFSKMFNLITPAEIEKKLDEEREEGLKKLNGREPANLEEQAIALVGTTVYEKLIKGYTEKQWGMPCKELPSFIIKRLPVRMMYNNNYFNDKYQGIPIGGYTQIIEKLLKGIDVKLNSDFFENREEYEQIADKIVFTGQIDMYYNYKYGMLEYRTVRFETEDTDAEVPYTRIIEHKHFEIEKQLGFVKSSEIRNNKTIISREYSDKWNEDKEPYYPINNSRNNELYEKYKALSENDSKVIFGGRLGQYKYYDMDKVIENALEIAKEELSN